METNVRGDTAKAERRARRETENRARHEKEAASIILLRDRAETLNRAPKKTDFDEYLISQIKSALGPWPRALEKAGLVPVSESYLRRQEARRLKRRRSRSHREFKAEV